MIHRMTASQSTRKLFISASSKTIQQQNRFLNNKILTAVIVRGYSPQKLHQPPIQRQLSSFLPSLAAAANNRTCTMSTTTSENPFHCVKPGMEKDFITATMENATLSSTTEEGVLRFDFYQDQDVVNEFVLVEVYNNSTTAPAAHKETAHYIKWRDVVAPMMLEERTRRLLHNLYPTSIQDWKYPSTTTTNSKI